MIPSFVDNHKGKKKTQNLHVTESVISETRVSASDTQPSHMKEVSTPRAVSRQAKLCSEGSQEMCILRSTLLLTCVTLNLSSSLPGPHLPQWAHRNDDRL